jgi:hypothetical protein
VAGGWRQQEDRVGRAGLKAAVDGWRDREVVAGRVEDEGARMVNDWAEARRRSQCGPDWTSKPLLLSGFHNPHRSSLFEILIFQTQKNLLQGKHVINDCLIRTE